MSNYFLEHYGVAGMKWGRRRVSSLGPPVIELGPDSYRETNGSSSSGNRSTGYRAKPNSSSNSSSGGSNKSSSDKFNRRTYDNAESTKPKPKQPNDDNTTSPTNKLSTNDVQTGLKSGKQITDAGVKMLEADRKKRNAKQLKNEAKEMTDDDLKQVISRLSMEEKYVSVMEKQGFGESKTSLQKTLETVGDVVSYADTALSIYKTIENMRGR